MTYLLDTNVIIALQNDQPKQVRPIFESHAVARTPMLIPSIVLFELWFGVSKSARYEANAERLAIFLRGSGAIVVPFDEDDARTAGELRNALERRGTPIGPYDLLIAAQALRRGATLVTSNTDEFHRVDGLAMEDWTT